MRGLNGGIDRKEIDLGGNLSNFSSNFSDGLKNIPEACQVGDGLIRGGNKGPHIHPLHLTQENAVDLPHIPVMHAVDLFKLDNVILDEDDFLLDISQCQKICLFSFSNFHRPSSDLCSCTLGLELPLQFRQ